MVLGCETDLASGDLVLPPRSAIVMGVSRAACWRRRGLGLSSRIRLQGGEVSFFAGRGFYLGVERVPFSLITQCSSTGYNNNVVLSR